MLKNPSTAGEERELEAGGPETRAQLLRSSAMMVSVGDVRLFVDVDGAQLVPDGDSMRNRPTIVMLHGMPGDHSPFKEVYAGFSAFAQVVYYDHRGCGRSEDGDPERWNLDQWADDLVALCHSLGIEQPVVFGVSFGGNLTLNHAIRYPDHPAKIVVVSCAARINPARSIEMWGRLGGPEVRAAAERWYASPADDFESFMRVCGPFADPTPPRSEIVARGVLRMPAAEHLLRNEYLQHDLRPELGRIECPMLLLAGELDPVVPIDEVEDLAHRLPPGLGRLERFPNSGHGLRGQGEAVSRLVREFVLDGA
jgi:pimeloyl-ACP methyl ester carboxylesterase